jgi:hypothetical protein
MSDVEIPFTPDAEQIPFTPDADATPGALEQARLAADRGRKMTPEQWAAQTRALLVAREAMRPVQSGTMPPPQMPEADAALDAIGVIGGGILGAAGGPAGAVAGAGLGLAGARQASNAIRYATGDPMPPSPYAGIIQAASDVSEGAAAEAGGQIAGKLAGAAFSAIGPAVRRSAEKSVAQGIVYGGAPKAVKAQAEKVIPEILDRPIGDTFAVTKGGMKAKADAAREAAGEAINAAGKLEGRSDLSRIVNALERAKGDFLINEGPKKLVGNPKAIANIEAVQNQIRSYGESLSDEGLRELRRILDDEIAKGKGFLIDPDARSMLQMKKVASDEIRGLLAEKHPEIARLNKQYTFWANLDDVLADTVQRTRPHRGLMGALSALSGATAGLASGGGVGKAAIYAGLFKAVESAATSPGWKLASAKVKNQVAEALMGGNPATLADALRKVGGYDARSTAMLYRLAALSSMPATGRYVQVGDRLVRAPSENDDPPAP